MSKPVFQLLTEEQKNALAQAAFDILEQTGVRITESEGRALLIKAGARLDGRLTFIPHRLVQEALRSAQREIHLYHRDGREAIQLGGHKAYYGAHSDAPDILDPLSGARRPCLEADVRQNAALIESLPRIDFLTASGLVADRPAEIADRVSFANCLIYARKPILAMPLTQASLSEMHAMAALASGGSEALKARPTIVIYAEPVSPLVHPDESIRKLLYCSDHHLPVAYIPFAAQGASAPQSLWATVAQLSAESLSGLVIHQLKQPGAPFIFGGMASVMDMHSTVFSYGAPEFEVGNTMLAEMAHHFGLANFGTAGTSDAQCLDGQTFIEVFSSLMLAHLSGAQLVHDIGLLGSATLVSPEMIVASDEILGMLAHMFSEETPGNKTFSTDLFNEAHVRGEFLSKDYTLEHFREIWYPRLFYRRGAKHWQNGISFTFEQRLKARTQEIIRTGQPEALDRDVVQAIWNIITPEP